MRKRMLAILLSFTLTMAGISPVNYQVHARELMEVSEVSMEENLSVNKLETESSIEESLSVNETETESSTEEDLLDDIDITQGESAGNGEFIMEEMPEQLSQVPEEMIEVPVQTTEEGKEKSAVSETLSESNGEFVYGGTITEKGANITWGIDANGKLVVSGTGEFSSRPWQNYPYNREVKSAEISVSGSGTMSRLLAYCEKLERVDFSGSNMETVTDISDMFLNCTALKTVEFGEWNIGNVTDMSGMFYGCSSLESLDLREWNTELVTDTSLMFCGCAALTTLNLEGWNVKNVKNAERMFLDCSALTQLKIGDWKPENLTNMDCMFQRCSSLSELDLKAWNVEKVTNMRYLFAQCKKLVKVNLSDWNTESATNMEYMFSGCELLEEVPLTILAVGEDADLRYMYENCVSLKVVDISNWNIENASILMGMFTGCKSLNHITMQGWKAEGKLFASMFSGCSGLQTADMSNWKATGANLGSMFSGCSNLHTVKLSGFNAENADMSFMFSSCQRLQNIDIEGLNIKGVTSMSDMFSGCGALTEMDMSSWDFTGVGKLDSMFRGCSSLEKVNLKDSDLSSVTTMAGMFYQCTNLTEVDLRNVDTANVTSMAGMFSYCWALENLDLSDLDTSNVQNMSAMFESCKALKKLDLSSFDTRQVTTMSGMFESCSGLEELDLTNWDTRSLTDMSRMFSDCEIWRFLELGNLNTQNVIDMSELFFNCNTITEITLEDLNGLNTSNVQTMEGMFAQSEKLKKVNLKNLDISNVSDISGMFDGCRALDEVELSNWDTQNVQEMSTMFRQCTSLREVDFSSWNTENLRTSAAMFEDCTALTSVDVSTWKTHNLRSIASMFEGCKSLTELDLGNFDLRNGTNSTSLVEDCEALTLIIAPRNNDTWVLLPVNYKDQWYLSDGSSITTLPMGQNYNPAIRRNSIPDPSEDRRQLEDIVVNGIEINGSGIAHVTFPLLNNNGNIQKNKNVWYRFEVSEAASVSENQESLEVALSEEDGYVTVSSPVLTNTTGENEQVTLTTHLWMEDEKKGREELLYTVTFHATVKPLAFAQSWELGVEGSVTGKISEGVGAKVGVGSVEASLAEAEITGTVGGNLSVEHELDGDTRNLTLFQTYNAKIAGNASAGLAGEAKLLGKELEIDIASAEGGVAAGASVGIGLQLEDYDPQNIRQLTEIGKFMMASQAQATGNAMLLRLAELTGVNFYNLTQVGHAISVEAGANLGSLELDDVTEGSLLAASKERVFSYDITKNREDGSKEFAFTRNGVDEIGVLNLSQDVGIGSIDHSVFSTSADTSMEVSAEVDGNGTVQGFSVKKEVADSEGSINTTGTVEAVEVSYEQEAVEQLARESNVVNKFINGTSYYIMGEAQKELFEDLDESVSEGLYTVSMTNQKMTEVEFEVGLTAVLGLEAGVAFEGAHSYEYETAGGTYEAGAKHITHTNEIEDLVKAKDEEYNIVKLVVEPFTTVVKSVTDFLADASEDIKEGVRNALAELKQSGQLSEENLPDWILHLVTVKTDEKSEEMVSQSYEIMAYSPLEEIVLMSNEETEVEEQKVYTIGDPYCVYVTDVDGNEVADYSENPLELTLKYTDEMLTGTGVSEKDLEKLAIYQYSEELLGYVCRGGALDKENQCVTLEITKPGQYLLAIDSKAPTVTTINVEANGNRPIIRVNFDEDCGFKEFSLKIDDTEYLGTADWNAYYNAPLRQITYQPETELSEGNHTLTVYAVDGAGNAMEEPAAYQFYVDTQAPVLNDMELIFEGNTLVIKAWTEDTDVLKMTATVSQNQMTEVIKTSTLQMISDNGCYHTELTLEEGADSVSVSVMAEDQSGNKSQPLVETKNVESQREGLRYVFVDGSGLEHSEYTYTGSAIIPEVLIYDGNTLLTLKKDYTLAYSKNVNVGTGVITVKGKGNYANKTTINFTIKPKDISDNKDESIVVSEITAVKNKKIQKPIPVITYNKKKLSNKKNKDFAVTYPDNAEGAYEENGSYIVHVEGKGNYTGSRDITFFIGEKNVNRLSVSKIAPYEYNGSAITPEVIVKDGKNTLVKGTHYTLDYKNNTEAGTASISITGIAPAYVGTKTVNFKINGVSVNKVKITGIPRSVMYNSESWKPQLTLTYNGEPPLAEGIHYTVEYGENTEVGKGRITIIGKGRFYGKVVKTFSILPFDTKMDKSGQLTVQQGISTVYAKGGAKPQPEVKFNGILLTNETDYTLSYSNNKAITTSQTKKKPSVTVKLKGNYKGSLKTEFTITPQSLALLTVTGVDKVEAGGKYKWKSGVIITDLDGKVLKSGTDYEKTLGYYLDENCSIPAEADSYGKDTVIWVKVTGKGNYGGSEGVTRYRILEQGKSIASAKVKIKDQSYHGGEITIDSNQIEYVKVNGQELVLGEHYVIIPESYKNNTKKGNATVQLKGINEYGGTYTAKFRIKEKVFQWKNLLEVLGINFD